LAVCGGVFITAGLGAGCATQAEDQGQDNEEVAFAATEQSITAAGDPLPGISAADFATALTAFGAVDEADEGLGPIFNEAGCGVCHSLGATGGAGVQIERRFGRFDNGRFNGLANKGGSLRQLFSLGKFTATNGTACNVPVESEPAEATVHNVGRLTTPLFGVGLIEALPDSAITVNAQNQAAGVRGTINRVPVLLTNPDDAGQAIGSTRVGRFGWKSGIATLAQFAADAYLNEMGVTTQHCIGGRSVLTFANESKPNGVPNKPGCDDLVVRDHVDGIPDETDEIVGTCAPGQSQLQEDVEQFVAFMTFLAPAPRLAIDPNVNLRGGTVFNQVGCAQCHLLRDYVTPSRPGNGVPGNFSFRPRSDFLVHDIGTGDSIGNDGDSQATTNRIRTAPLWGLHLRTKFLHDGSATSIEQAIARHGGQATNARNAFNNLGAGDRNAMLAAMRSD
jgi:CxxC motif-containing protein (DUF1111 family)